MVPLKRITEEEVPELIARGWKKKDYRPTVGLVMLARQGNRIGTLLVKNKKSGSTIPSGEIGQFEDLRTAAFRNIKQELVMNIPLETKTVLHGYYDHVVPKEWRPQGFSRGKRYIFVSLVVNEMKVKPKAGPQYIFNPVISADWVYGLRDIHSCLSDMRDDQKRRLLLGVINAAPYAHLADPLMASVAKSVARINEQYVG